MITFFLQFPFLDLSTNDTSFSTWFLLVYNTSLTAFSCVLIFFLFTFTFSALFHFKMFEKPSLRVGGKAEYLVFLQRLISEWAPANGNQAGL